MSDLSELMELRPLVSELRHTVEQLRRDKGRIEQELTAERTMNEDLRRAIIALRVGMRSNETPALGTDIKTKTAALSKRWTEPK